MAKKKYHNWRMDRSWPILPVDAECPCPKRGGGMITWGSCQGCKFLAGVSYSLGIYSTIRCNHKNRNKSWSTWLRKEK